MPFNLVLYMQLPFNLVLYMQLPFNLVLYMQLSFNLVLYMQSSFFAYTWIFIKSEKLETKQIWICIHLYFQLSLCVTQPVSHFFWNDDAPCWIKPEQRLVVSHSIEGGHGRSKYVFLMSTSTEICTHFCFQLLFWVTQPLIFLDDYVY